MEADAKELSAKDRPRLGWLKIALIGMSGYLLGSFLPAGYVRYLIQSKLFPETLALREEPFDRAKLRGAAKVTQEQLLSTLETNPGLFGKQYLYKPVTLAGTVKYFLDSSSGRDDFTLTLDTGDSYGAPGIFLTFDDARSSAVTALRKGGKVTATCMITNISTDSIHMHHCEAEQ